MIHTVFDLTLAALILLTALAAIMRRQLFGAVAFFIVYGVTISLAWLRLGAVDVALAEVAIGAGMTGFLLFGAVARVGRLAPGNVAPGPVLPRVLTAFAAAAIGGAIGWVFLTLPAPAGLQAEVAARIALTGVENSVTAVLLAFRAWDTLLETIVLLTALISVWSLTRDEKWGGEAGPVRPEWPDEVLPIFARVLPPIGLLVGVYLIWAGSSRAGGAFQGGTVLAAMLLLMIMAGLMPSPQVGSTRVRTVLVFGPAVFLVVALVGTATGQFLYLPPEHSKALILVIEAALSLSIALTLALLLLGPPEQGASE